MCWPHYSISFTLSIFIVSIRKVWWIPNTEQNQTIDIEHTTNTKKKHNNPSVKLKYRFITQVVIVWNSEIRSSYHAHALAKHFCLIFVQRKRLEVFSQWHSAKSRKLFDKFWVMRRKRPRSVFHRFIEHLCKIGNLIRKTYAHENCNIFNDRLYWNREKKKKTTKKIVHSANSSDITTTMICIVEPHEKM